MSTVEPLDSSAAPVVNEALEPESVRNGSAATKQAYSEALDFESLLVNQLAQQLTQSSGFMGADGSDADGSDSGSSSANGEFASLLPGALTSAIMADGGLGIASGLMSSLDPQGASAATGAQAAGAPALDASTGGTGA
jgi:Rod binding domain-containing protein